MYEQKEKKARPKYDYSNLRQWIEGAYIVAVDDTAGAEQQRNRFNCARCGTNWSCPTITLEQRKELADSVRQAHIFDTEVLFMQAGFTFAEAKPTMLHITIFPGKCHKCKRALPDDSEQVVCRCRSLNLNW